MTRYAKTMSQALAEMKMNDPKLLKVFDKLKPRDTIQLKVSSSIAKGKDFQPYTVKSKNTLRNGVEKITMILQGNPTGVKRFLYKRDGKVTFAIGDMGASIDDIKEGLEEGYESEVLKILDDAGIDGYFKNNKLYVSKRDARDAKKALDDSDEITKLPKMVKEGTWKMPDNPKEVAALKKLMSRPLPIGNTEDEKMYKDSANAKLYGLLGDDELFDALGALEDKGKEKADARKTIIKWFKQRVKDDSYGLGDETKELGKKIGLKMDYVPEEVELTERVSKELALATLSMNKNQKFVKVSGDFVPEIYLSRSDREKLKKRFGRLPRGFPSPEDGMTVVSMINYALGNKDGRDPYDTEDGDSKSPKLYNYDTGKVVGKPKTVGDAAKMAGLRLESVELDEKYDLYHKTFSDAMQHAYDYAKKKLGITVDPKEIDNKVATGPRKPSEGKTNKYRLKGKGGNLQIQVYNKGGSKPFELNMYKEENEMYDKLTDGNLSLKETVLKMWQEAAKDKDEGNAFGAALAAAKEKGEDTFVVAGKKYDVKTEKLVGGQKKLDKDKDGDIDGKDFAMLRKQKKNNEEHQRYLETKKGSLRDAVLQMWGEKKDLTKEMENGKNKKTDTGKEMTPVDMSPKMPKVKESKNKV